eukprot:9299443-Lingulodinium_polyedra.AAC.1
MLREDGSLACPVAEEREVLMGFPRGHTRIAWQSGRAKADPEGLECARRSFVGNSFQCEVVAWLLGHFAYAQKFVQRLPDPA